MERADRRKDDSVWEIVCSLEGKCRDDTDTGKGSESPAILVTGGEGFGTKITNK